MSKPIGRNENAKAWAVPEIRAASDQHATHTDSSLSPRERKAVEERVDKIKESAYREGFQKGQQDGMAGAQQQFEQALLSLKKLLDAMVTPYQNVEGQVEEELVKLAVAIAKQIVRREMKTDPGQIVGVVREALGIISSSAQNVRVFLCPDDAALVRNVMPDSSGEASWEIVEDPVLTPGSCRVETDAAVVDASVESRIAAIAAEILGSERADE
jgi:flagellar assembly protein FliH